SFYQLFAVHRAFGRCQDLGGRVDQAEFPGLSRFVRLARTVCVLPLGEADADGGWCLARGGFHRIAYSINAGVKDGRAIATEAKIIERNRGVDLPDSGRVVVFTEVQLVNVSVTPEGDVAVADRQVGDRRGERVAISPRRCGY